MTNLNDHREFVRSIKRMLISVYNEAGVADAPFSVFNVTSSKGHSWKILLFAIYYIPLTSADNWIFRIQWS